MTRAQVYEQLGQFLISVIPDELKGSWDRAELNIKIQPGMTGFSGNCFVGERRQSLRTKAPEELSQVVKAFHALTTQGGNSKWNKATFTLYPDRKFEMTFEWDKIWQDEVDTLNTKEEKRDANYQRPKWPWEN